MHHHSVLIKPASSLCNMRCTYCFYADVSSLRTVRSYGIMTDEVAEAVIERVHEGVQTDDEVTFAFQGGEPTIAGASFMRRFVQTVESRYPSIVHHYALQTNGLLLDDEWGALLSEYRFLVGLSLDGDGTTHDACRVDANGQGTFARVMQAKRLLERYEVDYNILWVLTAQTALHPHRAWNFLKHNMIKYVQFVPCLDDLQNPRQDDLTLTPRQFASFYNTLFPLWKQSLERGKYLSIKFFDDLFNVLTKQLVTECGFTGNCQIQYIIEADGSVYPCDFYVLDEWKLGNVLTDGMQDMGASAVAATFLARQRTDGRICSNCPYRTLCGGGCPRMKDAMYLNKSGTFCGYREFLDTNRRAIDEVASRLG